LDLDDVCGQPATTSPSPTSSDMRISSWRQRLWPRHQRSGPCRFGRCSVDAQECGATTECGVEAKGWAAPEPTGCREKGGCTRWWKVSMELRGVLRELVGATTGMGVHVFIYGSAN
jgi:hypothetical protein